jgi:D-allulose-6-phosphate 3-epimerase
MKVKFAPSLMCMDLMNVQNQIGILDQYADYYHIDIMDGHFVKNLSLSLDFVKRLKLITNIPLDCHLMTSNPEVYVDQLIEIGADFISLHAETISGQAFRLIERIKQADIKFGVVLNPETDLHAISSYLHLVDILTIMSVDPGFAGQKFIVESIDKVRLASSLKADKQYSYEIAVDGGCNKKTYKILRQAGAECFIVGSSGLFGLHENLNLAYELMIREYEQETACI